MGLVLIEGLGFRLFGCIPLCEVSDPLGIHRGRAAAEALAQRRRAPTVIGTKP